MGCGVSRFNANGTQISAKLSPIFQRRIEEIRRRRHSRSLTNTTPSKKVLLGHDRDEDDETEIASQHPRKKPYLPEDTDSCVTSEDSKAGPEKKKASDDSSTARREALVNDINGGERDVKVVYLVKEEVKVGDGEDGDHEHEGDDDGRRLSHDYGEGIFPGSPSFRVYFTDKFEDKKNESDYTCNEDNTDDESLNDNVAQRQSVDVPSYTDDEALHDNVAQRQPVDVPSSKDSETKKVRGRKRTSFRKVIPRGGHAAVRNLLNVRSCYTSSRSSHDRAHLLTEKTPA